MKSIMRALPFLLIANFCFSYSPSDLKKWQETKTCINCDLSRINIYSGNYNSTNLESAKIFYSTIERSYFRQSNFAGVYLSKSGVRESVFTECNFSNAHLNLAAFYNNEFSGSKFINADLSNSDFTASNLSSTDFTGAKLDGVDFTGAILIGSNISTEQLSKTKSLKNAILPDGSLVSK